MKAAELPPNLSTGFAEQKRGGLLEPYTAEVKFLAVRVEREKCYAGIKKCDAFLKTFSLMFDGNLTPADKIPPEIACAYFCPADGRTNGAKVFHLKAKIGFIRRLVEMQDAGCCYEV
ncbi:MAG: hypothetical protein ACTTKL_11295 [Treponema sp.]